MTDYLLLISFPSDPVLEEVVQSRLFVTSSRGSSSSEADGTTTISAYFSSDDERAAGEKALGGLAVTITQSDREPVDWLVHYQQSLQAMEIGESFIVAPDVALIPVGSGRIPIVVPQEQAFGTGSHESTALCMMLLESIGVEDRRGLDIGSGSGILAIAAVKLGAAGVIAFDNDVDAYGALRDNRLRNGIDPDRMPLFIGGTEAVRNGRFDFVTMNIVPEVIIPLLPSVVARMSGRAQLIVSGVLVERRQDVITAASGAGLSLRDEKTRGEWWAGVFQRSK